MTRRTNSKPCYISPKALSWPELPPQLRKLGRSLVASDDSQAFSAPVIVAFSSELIRDSIAFPEWTAGGTTRYLIVVDVPDQLLPRVFSRLDLRRPDQRLHATRDAGAIRRLLVAMARREPMLGIVDAYIWDEVLTLVTGDFHFRSFPLNRVPRIAELPSEEQGQFEVDVDGSHLYWPSGDIHLGVSQILQHADPMYLADIAIERNRQDHTGAALRRLREEHGLRQADITGLSERQVRRIEDGISRLRVETAEKFATAFGMDLSVLLDRVGRYAGEIHRASLAPRKGVPPRTRNAPESEAVNA
jgi:hypothetical protein